MVSVAVDEDRVERRRRALERAGLRVETSRSVEDALARVEREPVDCVVTDHDDSVDGLALPRLLGPEGPPVVLEPADGSERLAGEAVAAGVAGYVPGDAGTDVLVERVRSAIARADADPDPDRVTADRGRELAALQRRTHALLRADTVDAVAESIAEATSDVFGLDRATVRLYDPDTDALVVAAGTPTVESERDGLAPVAVDDPDDPVAEAYREDYPVGIDAVTAENFPRASEDVGCFVAYPLGDHGVMAFGSLERDGFSAADVGAIGVLAAIAESALDRVRYEAGLRRERDRLGALFENVPMPAVRVRLADSEAMVTDVNAAFESGFGYDADAAIGRSLDDLVVPEDEAARRSAAGLTDRVADGEVVQASVRRLTADGRRDFRLTAVPVDVGEVVDAFVFYRDVTERRRRRQRVEVLNRVLRHDLRNGMNIVKGAAQSLLDRETYDSDRVRAIHDRSRKLLSVAEKTREIEGTLDTDDTHAPIDLVETVTAIADDVHADWPDATVVTDLPETCAARGGEPAVAALRNVIENAVEHNDDDPWVSVRVVPNGNWAEITVADDGPGIPPTDRRILSGADDITQLRHGSGLGLWLTNWVVTTAGGEVDIQDRAEGGTLVTLWLPLRDGAADA